MSIPVFSVHGLIAWLETQNPETEYNYMDSNDCLLCRYFRACGVRLRHNDPMGPYEWMDADGIRHNLLPALDHISITASTYGAALARAKETEAAHAF